MKPLLLVVALLCVAAVPPYKDMFHQYTITYPEGWEEQEIDPTIHAFLSPRMDTADPFRENINIVTDDVSTKGTTLAQYVQFTRSQYQGALGKKVLTVDKAITLNGLRAHQFEYIIPPGPHNERKFPLQYRQIITAKSRKIYVITYTAHPKGYAAFLKPAAAAMATFRPL